MSSEQDQQYDHPLTEAEVASMELCCEFANLSEAELLAAVEELADDPASES